MSEVTITAIGGNGDGLAITPDGDRVFIPTALPGETWDTRERPAIRTSAPAEDRVAPPCTHFTVCGGCTAQHMARKTYRNWKVSRLQDALSRANLAPDITDLWQAEPGTRRRLTLEAHRDGKEITIGLAAAKSHARFDMTECPVANPKLVATLDPLRALCRSQLSPHGAARITLTTVRDGVAIAIAAKPRDIASDRVRPDTMSDILAAGICQVTLNDDVLVASARPTLTLGSATTSLPNGSFLQAVPEAEIAMQTLVCQALSKERKIIDLFAGLGTFALPLAKTARVTASDSDRDGLEALAHTAKAASGIKPLTTLRRDLFREPLSARELKDFTGAVINPPRAGADAQTRAIAASTLRTVTMVSCNPKTFARDARTLVEAGFALGKVHPLDQFLWSPHLEVVGTFTRRRECGRRTLAQHHSPAR
ncbi:MAG: hypothetical protein AAGJ70_03045 [Pseudomonadota bacterium]